MQLGLLENRGVSTCWELIKGELKSRRLSMQNVAQRNRSFLTDTKQKVG